MPKLAEAPVTTRFLTPPPAEDPDAARQLYEPVPQLDGEPPFKMKYRWFSPAKADELLKHSDSDPAFRQRMTSLAQVRRHMNLMRTNRFVHMLPNGVICLDPDGIMLNGKHRMTAVAGQENEIGFVVFENVPRWMFKFMDTGKALSVTDVFFRGVRDTTPQTSSAMKLALRYEEFLRGMRPAAGWRHWAAVKDEHHDVDGFLARRQELNDWHGVGMSVQRSARLMAPSVMVFYFYQSLAWPEGADMLETFCSSLVTGGGLATSPSLALREWAKEAWYNKDRILSKREAHLHLLFRTFEQYAQQSRIPRVVWAYGNPMAMPYHPKGHDKAIQNARFALEKMDSTGGDRSNGGAGSTRSR